MTRVGYVMKIAALLSVVVLLGACGEDEGDGSPDAGETELRLAVDHYRKSYGRAMRSAYRDGKVTDLGEITKRALAAVLLDTMGLEEAAT